MDLISVFVGVLIGAALCIAMLFLLPADGKLIVRKGEDGNNQYMFQIEDVDKAVTKPRIILAVGMYKR
ncbi:MAG: hypothetical protein IJW61_01325 [Clostridia bacterium]|nr:hypothetical protein [Clostridia bacterium]